MFYIFRFLRPTLLFVILLVLTLPQRAAAQSLSLDTTTFYADSALVHTGLAVRWTGALSWGTTAASTAYSLVYSFGDGAGYTVSKVTGNSAGGSDTFQAVHAYASAGNYTAKVVLKNASGIAIDSLVRSGSADSGYVVSGRYYYDCIRNCTIDTGELWMKKTWLRYKVGSQYRRCLTDSLGYYSIAIPTGQTFYRTPVSTNNWNTTTGSCVWAPITATDRAAHVALWLTEKIRITNFQAPPYACLGSFYQIGVTGIQESSNLWNNPLKVLFKAGNGAESPYGSGGGSQFDWYFIYPVSGTYTVAAEMYLADYSGPYMRLEKTVQVDSCRSI